MRPFAVIAALMGVAMAAPRSIMSRQGKNVYTSARAGEVDNIVLRADNTLNATSPSPSDSGRARDPVVGDLDINLVNNFEGGALNAYISGLDSDGRIVFLTADSSLVYPSSGGSETPVEVTEDVAIPLPAEGETLSIHLPIAMSSGRVYFAEGELTFHTVDIGDGLEGLVQPSISDPLDPSAEINWGFTELTLTTEGAIWANISFVDYVGLPFGMSITNNNGSTQEVLGLRADGVAAVCEKLVEQGNEDGRPWGAHCIAGPDGTPLRALSTNNYHELDPSGFADYWTEYVDEVWDHYRNATLQFNTQNDDGIVDCRVEGDTLECDGDNRGYAKPTAVDILSCDSGPFGILEGDNSVHYAVVPRLCAAFVRTTLLLDGGDFQPGLTDEYYYIEDPTHHYSRIVHEEEVDGRGYAFPYDDVHADGVDNAGGLLTESDPDNLTFYVGGVRD